MRNPISLLFEEATHRRLKHINFWGPGVKLGEDILSKSDYESLHPIIKKWKGKRGVLHFDSAVDLWDVPHIRLTGWMMSRLQANNWYSNVKQDFRLKPSKGSWTDVCWQSYRRALGLSNKVLSTFTVSSFACHDLLMWPNKSRKGKVRYITSAHKVRSKHSSKKVK